MKKLSINKIETKKAIVSLKILSLFLFTIEVLCQFLRLLLVFLIYLVEFRINVDVRIYEILLGISGVKMRLMTD